MVNQDTFSQEQVGFAFLREFIKVYKGSTIDIITDEERERMLKSIDKEDSDIYSKYREIYWHFLVLTSDRETAAADARYWYLKLKMAIADGETLKKDETDNFAVYVHFVEVDEIRNNQEKVTGIYRRYCRALYTCRRLEIVMEMVAQAVGIDDSPYRGMELFNTYIDEANKLINEATFSITPIRATDFELGSEVYEHGTMLWAGEWIDQKQHAIKLASTVIKNPAVIYELRALLVLDI